MLYKDGIWPGGVLNFDKMTAVSPNDNTGSVLGNNSSLSLTMISNGGSVRPENCKRPMNDDQSCQPGCKRTRGLETDKPPPRSTCEQSYNYVAADEEFKTRKDPAVPEESTKKLPGSIYSFPWLTYCTSEEDSRLDTPIRLSFYPGYYEDYHNQLDEIHSPVFDYHRRKPVSLGKNHQADVPQWRPKFFTSSSGGSDINYASISSRKLLINEDNATNEDNADKWIKYCVIPMPDSDSVTSEGLIGHCKGDCFCLDEGSVRCIKQHVAEAREKFRVTVGNQQFVELGFCDMGEDVALRWSEHEEQLFHEIIMSNPASLGKNFWDVLPLAFLSRSKRELVSYYFNVFMLRKRAEQNRSDPLNVDSDNDEWQDSDDREFAATEEDDDDEDSGVESLADDVLHKMGGHGEMDTDEESEGEDCNGFAGGIESTFGPHLQPMSKIFDVHDDSCTSYEDPHNRVDSCHANVEGPPDNFLEDDHENMNAEYRNDGMSSMADHEYIVGDCDTKSWDIGYIRGVEKDLEFLPTCNVIEEVLGHGSCEK